MASSAANPLAGAAPLVCASRHPATHRRPAAGRRARRRYGTDPQPEPTQRRPDRRTNPGRRVPPGCPVDGGPGRRRSASAVGRTHRLHPARHLSIPEEDPEVTSRSASWWDAVPIDVPVTIRRQNRSNSTGRASRQASTHATRQLLRHRRRREREQARAALARLLTNGPARLSDFSRLDRHEFDLLLDLLSDALSARRVGGVRSAVSGASGVQIVLQRPRARVGTRQASDRRWDLHRP